MSWVHYRETRLFKVVFRPITSVQVMTCTILIGNILSVIELNSASLSGIVDNNKNNNEPGLMPRLWFQHPARSCV